MRQRLAKTWLAFGESQQFATDLAILQATKLWQIEIKLGIHDESALTPFFSDSCMKELE